MAGLGSQTLASSTPGRLTSARYSVPNATQRSVSAITAGLQAIGSRNTLKPDSFRALTTNQLGNLVVQLQPTARAEFSRPYPLGAGSDGWSLGFQIASADDPRRRSAGSYSWAGIFNTHFWVDPRKKLAAVLLMQTLPFYDDRCIALLRGFEERVYAQ